MGGMLGFLKGHMHTKSRFTIHVMDHMYSFLSRQPERIAELGDYRSNLGGFVGYKIAERLGGCSANGPFLQGLTKPTNGLSPGCTADDVVNTVILTVLQTAGSNNRGASNWPALVFWGCLRF